ncbi:MAG: DUF3575 domain-containing protein [Kofleriaceae bacterium]|nr:DUF3575 domain-containing protein [Kofleriaceae bacterium]
MCFLKCVLLAASLVLVASPASAQELPTPAVASESAQKPKWTLQVDPLTSALGLFHLHVEYAFANHHSLYLSPSIRLIDSVLTDEEYDAVGIEAAYRYFWRGNAPFGPWASVRVVGSSLSKGSEDNLGGYAGVLGGYTWLIGQHVTLALGLGVQYFQFEVGGSGLSGIRPAAHTAFGLAF